MSGRRHEIEVRLRKARGYDSTEFGVAHETIRRRIKNLYVTRSKLLAWRNECLGVKQQAESDIKDVDQKLAVIEGMIADIETQEGKVVISEHALLRYLERVKKLDLEAICDEIRELDKSKVVRRGNVIITVNGDKE